MQLVRSAYSHHWWPASVSDKGGCHWDDNSDIQGCISSRALKWHGRVSARKKCFPIFKTKYFIGACLTAAFVLYTLGLANILRADPVKARKGGLEQYEEVVEEWNRKRRDEFAAVEWWVKAGHKMVKLEPQEVEDPPVECLNTLPKYMPLQFYLPDLYSTLPFAIPTASELTTPRELAIVAQSGESESVISLGEYPLVERVEKVMGGWKVCTHQEGGIWGGDQCVSFRGVESICLKVVQDGVGAGGGADTSFGGPGCSPLQTWQPVQRSRIAPGATVEETPLPLSSGSVTVRSAFDPHLVALNITQGSLMFAIDEVAQLYLGYLFCTIGASLCIPPVFLSLPYAWRSYREYKRRRRERWGRGHELAHRGVAVAQEEDESVHDS